MTSILQFQFARHPSGYRVVTLDRKRWRELEKSGAIPSEAPAEASEDERRAFKRFGRDLYLDGLEGHRHWLEPLSPKIEYYDLFTVAPGMFLNFANTPTSIPGVRNFADRYGWLADQLIWYVEEWYQYIRELRRAVIAWEKAKVSGDFRAIARIFNKGARHSTAEANFPGVPVRLSLVANKAEAIPRLGMRPQDFMDALWVQLALAIEGNKTYEACVACGTWFPLSSNDFRSDKRYCSDACRMRAYRKRKAARLG